MSSEKPPPAAPPEAHKRISGYEILSKLGQGGMGAVYKARQVSLDRLVALKVLPKQLTDKADFVGRFSREARLTGQLNHPNIVKVYDVGQSSTGIWYYAMEYVEGESLRAVLEREGKLPVKRLARVLVEMASALDHAHKLGIVHRDIKPDNILVNREGVSKLADLGLAKPAGGLALGKEASFSSMAGAVVGTPYYMSPEQIEGKVVDIRSDLYSLGATAFHLLAGGPPFDAETAIGVLTKHVAEALPDLRQKAPGVPPALSAIIHRLMEKDPAKRFQTPGELASALAASKRELTGLALPRLTLPAGFGQRRILFALAAGGVLVGTLALLLYAKARSGRAVRAAVGGAPAVPVAAAPDERAAREALHAAQAFQDQNPGDREGLILRLQEVENRHRGTRAAQEAARQRQETEQMLRQSLEEREQEQEALATREKAIRLLLEGGHLAQAREWIESLPRTEAYASVVSGLDQALREAEQKAGASLAAPLQPSLSNRKPEPVRPEDSQRAARKAATQGFFQVRDLFRAREWAGALEAAGKVDPDLLNELHRQEFDRLKEAASLNLDFGWRCDFEDGKISGWIRGTPFIPLGLPKAPGIQDTLEARRRETVQLSLLKNGPEKPLSGKCSLKVASPKTTSNGEARSPEITLKPGALLTLRYHVSLAAEKGGPGFSPIPQGFYICLRDPKGDLLPCGSLGWGDVFQKGMLAGRDLGRNAKDWGTSGSPKNFEGEVQVPLDLDTRARLCLGFSLADAPGKTAVLIVDAIDVSYGKDMP